MSSRSQPFHPQLRGLPLECRKKCLSPRHSQLNRDGRYQEEREQLAGVVSRRQVFVFVEILLLCFSLLRAISVGDSFAGLG